MRGSGCSAVKDYSLSGKEHYIVKDCVVVDNVLPRRKLTEVGK